MRAWLVLMLMLAWGGPALAQETDPITVYEALATALDNSPVLKEYESRIREARYQVDEAYVQANPTVDFAASYRRISPEVAIMFQGQSVVVTPEHNYNLALTLNQAIYTFGRLKWSTLAAELQVRARVQEYRQQAEEILREVWVAYHTVLLAQEAVVIAEDRVAAQRAQLVDSENLYEAGVVARFDVLRNQAELSRVEQILLEAQNQVLVAKANLRTAMGLPPTYPLELVSTDLPPPPPPDWTPGLEQALEERPELEALRWAVEAGQARVRFEETQDNPRLDLQSQATKQNVTGFAAGEQWTTSLVFSVPLFDGGLSKARRNQAEEGVRQLQQNLEQVRRAVVLEVERAYLELVNTWKTMEVASRQLEEQTEALRVARVRYKEGISTNVELLDSQTAFSQAQFSVAEARFQYQEAWAAWRRAISGEYPVEVPGIPPETATE